LAGFVLAINMAKPVKAFFTSVLPIYVYFNKATYRKTSIEKKVKKKQRFD
jgi:hypothetical protein